MNNFDDLFIENCFLPCVGEIENNYVPQHKSIDILQAELDEIKNNIEEIKTKEWHLSKLMKFHQEGIAYGLPD